MIYSMFASYSHEISPIYIPQVPSSSHDFSIFATGIHKYSQEFPTQKPICQRQISQIISQLLRPNADPLAGCFFRFQGFPETATTIPNDFQRPGFAWKNPGPLGCPGQHVRPGLYWPPRPSRRWGWVKTPHRIHRLVVSSWQSKLAKIAHLQILLQWEFLLYGRYLHLGS